MSNDIRARLTVSNWISLIALIIGQAALILGSWVVLERRVTRLEENQKSNIAAIERIQATQATIANTAAATAKLVDHLAEEVRDDRRQ